MDIDIKIGDIVRSLSGHDKDRLFVVINIDKNEKIAIIDGKFRPKDKPKFKNPKHLQVVAHDDEILSKISSPIVTNTEFHKLIEKYNKE